MPVCRLRDPAALLAAPGITRLIDFCRPVAVLLIAILHFIPDDADPAGILRQVISRLAPGSCVAISRATADFLTPEAALSARAAWAGASVPAVPRTRDQAAALFDGLAMIPPGLSDAHLRETDGVPPTVQAMTLAWRIRARRITAARAAGQHVALSPADRYLIGELTDDPGAGDQG